MRSNLVWLERIRMTSYNRMAHIDQPQLFRILSDLVVSTNDGPCLKSSDHRKGKKIQMFHAILNLLGPVFFKLLQKIQNAEFLVTLFSFFQYHRPKASGHLRKKDQHKEQKFCKRVTSKTVWNKKFWNGILHKVYGSRDLRLLDHYFRRSATLRRINRNGFAWQPAALQILSL